MTKPNGWEKEFAIKNRKCPKCNKDLSVMACGLNETRIACACGFEIMLANTTPKPNGWEQNIRSALYEFAYDVDREYGEISLESGIDMYTKVIMEITSQAILSAEEAKVREIKSKLPYIYALGFENADRNMIRNKALQECHDVVDSFLSLPDQEQLTSKGKK